MLQSIMGLFFNNRQQRRNERQQQQTITTVRIGRNVDKDDISAIMDRVDATIQNGSHTTRSGDSQIGLPGARRIVIKPVREEEVVGKPAKKTKGKKEKKKEDEQDK